MAIFNLKLHFNRHRKISILVIFTLFGIGFGFSLIHPIVCILLGKFDLVQIIRSVSFSYINFYRAIYIVQFILSSATVKIRFAAFNRSLTLNRIFKLKLLEDLNHRKLYHSLCDAIDILNQTFTFQLVLIFMGLIVSDARERHWLCHQKDEVLSTSPLKLMTSFHMTSQCLPLKANNTSHL
jgi:hypothetical protein